MLDLTPRQIRVVEVGPRDGLQNEAQFVPTQDKIAWINHMSRTGIPYIEITSFVHPKWIPALADAAEVAKGIERVPGVTYAALVPNVRGLERALEADVDEVSVFMSASETHNQRNINKSIADTFPILEETARAALAAGKTVRGYVSTVFGCPDEGRVSVDNIIRVTQRLLEMGVREISLGDTIGVAHPGQVHQVLEALLKHVPSERLAMHFHDTYGMAIANTLIALDMGISTFDSSLGGLGGCPYAPGASGNMATEDLLYLLDGLHMTTGIHREQLQASALLLEERTGLSLCSHGKNGR